MTDSVTPTSRTPRIILAFDFGTQRIGVASGDTLTRTARPAKTLPAKNGVPWPQIETLIRALAPAQLVVGVPYNMDGTRTPLTRACLQFAQQLEQRLGLPVATIDERQSSREAEAQLRNARAQGIKRRQVTHADVDMAAAKVILERWFDQQHA